MVEGPGTETKAGFGLEPAAVQLFPGTEEPQPVADLHPTTASHDGTNDRGPERVGPGTPVQNLPLSQAGRRRPKTILLDSRRGRFDGETRQGALARFGPNYLVLRPAQEPRAVQCGCRQLRHPGPGGRGDALPRGGRGAGALRRLVQGLWKVGDFG